MKKLLLTSTVLVAVSSPALAQYIDGSLSLSSYAGTTLQATGVSSQAQLAVSGFGTGGVVVSNSGLNVDIAPDADAEYWWDADVPDADVDNDDSQIDVTNERSVEVSGVLAGIGSVQALGSTETTFDAQASAGADSGIEEDGYGEYTANATGLAALSGESKSVAGLQMAGLTADFIGSLGTTVGGSFDAEAGYDAYADGEDSESDSWIEIDVNPDDIDLAIANLGGGTMSLLGSNSDIFAGKTLASSDMDWSLDYNP